MDIVLLVSSGLSGIIIGILVGLFPGLGAASILLMLYPVLFNFDIISLIVFYIALVNSTQYYGSISAIVFGISGEISSLPAVRHGHSLFNNGHGKQALIYTSTGSFTASVVSLILFVTLSIMFSDFFVLMLKGSVIFSLLVLAFFIIVITSSKPLLSLLFGILGLILSQIGYDDLHNQRILTFGTTMLEGGLPIFPIFCGLIIIPLIYRFNKSKSSLSVIDRERLALSERIRYLLDFSYFKSVLRGSFLGFFIGLIPGCSYSVSSNIVDNVEGKIVIEDKNKITQSFKRLIAAESANNSGSVSVLIPLLIMAIPIVFSESILLGILEIKGFNYSVSVEYFKDNIVLLSTIILVVNIINWIVSGIFYNIILRIYQSIEKFIYQFVAILSIVIMMSMAHVDSQVLVSILTFFISLVIGMIIKNDDSKFVLVYSFFVSTIVTDEFYRLFLI